MVFEWTAPAGMGTQVAAAWRAFYREAASGRKGYTATPEMYVILYKAQLGRCFICQSARGIHPEDPKGKGSQRLGWDHNHATGAVRGLLCTKGQRSCNTIVGRYRDNPEAFARGAAYLISPPALVLAQVQRVASDLPVEERIRMATVLLGVGETAGRVARGHESSVIIVDEPHVAFNGKDLSSYVSKVEIGDE